MTSTFERRPVVNAYLSQNGRIALVPCPQCGFHHEHNVTVPDDRSVESETVDVGVYTSNCTDSPPIRYRIVLSDNLTAEAHLYIAGQNRSMADGALRRERRFYRERHQRWKQHDRDQARLARRTTPRGAFAWPRPVTT